MPAARPSRATISNTIAAAAAEGLTAVAITISADGSIRIEFRGNDQRRAPTSGAEQDADENGEQPLAWDDVA